MKAKKVLSIIFNSINMLLMLLLIVCGVCAVIQATSAVKGAGLINTLSSYFSEISNGLIVSISSIGISVGKIDKLVFVIIPLAITFLSFLFSLIILIKVSKNKRCLFSLIYKVVVEGLTLICLGYVIYVRLSNGMKINNFMIVVVCEVIVVLSLVFNFITMSGLPEKEGRHRTQNPSVPSNTNAGTNQGVQLNGGLSQINSYTSPVQNSSFFSQNQTAGYSFPGATQTTFGQTNLSQQNGMNANNINTYSAPKTNINELSGLFNSSTQTQFEPIDKSANQSLNSSPSSTNSSGFNPSFNPTSSFSQTNPTIESNYSTQNPYSSQASFGNSTALNNFQTNSNVTSNQSSVSSEYGVSSYPQGGNFTTPNSNIGATIQPASYQSNESQAISNQTSFGSSYNIDMPANIDNNFTNQNSQFNASQTPTSQIDVNNITQPAVSTDEFSIPSINQDNLNATTTNIQNSNPYGTDNNGNNN